MSVASVATSVGEGWCAFLVQLVTMMMQTPMGSQKVRDSQNMRFPYATHFWTPMLAKDVSVVITTILLWKGGQKSQEMRSMSTHSRCWRLDNVSRRHSLNTLRNESLGSVTCCLTSIPMQVV